jgi:hypothetical protein
LSRLDLADAQCAFLRVSGDKQGTSGDFTASLPADTIRARGHSVDVGEDNYQAVTLKEVLRGVIATWAYAGLPKVFRPDTTAQSFAVKTVADLEKALSAPNDTLLFIEAVMDPYDAPAPVVHSSNNGAELDYGPRGPHHRDNAQLRPA